MCLKVDLRRMIQKNFLEQPGAFKYFFENHPDGICIVDVEGRFIDVNTTALNMFGYTREEILQTSLDQLFNYSDTNGSKYHKNVNARFETEIQHKRGYLVYVELTCIPLVSDGREKGRFITFEDITEQWLQRKELLHIQEMFSVISEKSQNIISSFSADGVFTYISPTVKALLGYDPEEVIGKPSSFFSHPEDDKRLQVFRNSVYIDQDTVRFTGRVQHKNGEYRWYETTIEVIRNRFGEVIQTICVGRDITDRKEAEEKIAHLAYHDPLTNLPNRRLFKKRLSHLLKESKDELHGLMLLDLDGFKNVNDTYGHEMGDLLLIEVAKRLTQAVEDQGIVSRWGGDEFTVLRTNIGNKADLTSLIERIKDVISEPIIISGKTILITASIGVSFFTDDGNTAEVLIKKADEAMYRVKNQTINVINKNED
jgi:diguanylate cyclase (GGDEF)-like protein/PAS domain S-box-containing protein